MKNELKPYGAYKEIELNWLDKIPKHWDMVRNKNLIMTRQEIVGENHSKYTLLSLTVNGIIARDMVNAKGKFPKDFTTYQTVKHGDLVFCLFDVDETPRTIGLSKLDGMITGAYTVFEVSNINSKYLYYYYLWLDQNKELKPLYKGLRKVVPVDVFLRTKTPYPPIMEQDQIVRYLDYKLIKINKFIKAKKRLITILKEQKKAIISDAVTKGVNQKAKMKSTRVEWLGDIPSDWNLTKVKYMFTIKKEIAGREGYDVLSVTQSGLKIKDITKNEGQMAQNYSNYQLVEPNDFVMNHMDLITGFMDCSKYHGVTSPDYRVFVLKNGLENFHKYYMYFFQLCYMNKVFYGLGQGVSGFGRWRLQSDTFLNFMIPVPPLLEQKQIASYIDQKIKQIDIVIEKTQREIELITEFRNSLISDVVTGKVDVRGIVVPEVMEEEVELNENDDVEEITDDEEVIEECM